MKDLEIHFDGGRIRCSSAEARQRRESLGSGITTIPCDGRSNLDPILMSFFEQVICSSSTLVDNSLYNPYRYLILPMALESQGLYHATLAIAANTLKLSDSKYSLPALEHHSRALGHLRALLSHDSWGEKELDEMLGLVLMLCWFDISDNSRPSWVAHLNGFQDLSRTRQERPGRSIHSQELASFFDRYFAFHLVLARTAFRVNETNYQPMPPPTNLLQSPDTIDPYMGFSHSLLLLINQIAGLAWKPADEIKSMRATDVLPLRRRLEGLEQVLPSQCEDPNTEWNMMRTAVLPLWPLFLAGCCAFEEEERVKVMQLFEELEGIHRFGNVAPAMEVIKMVWRQKDLSVQDERKREKSRPIEMSIDYQNEARFSWEHAMSMLGGWKLSLT
ncbi:hypothetical protein N7450_006136 [Penicillium hetheringtonii]|uniref:Uncharacterized protein n=1 Tax=Penicillium hetheringtonii TaxID=911720 RepID=A0AAD6DJT1_9EURO|nr:hypothetical protein N7450_006136 [Penicillium hetheringtonii]